jgi:hypothetical protein
MSCPYKAAVEEWVRWSVRPVAATRGKESKRTLSLQGSREKRTRPVEKWQFTCKRRCALFAQKYLMKIN